MGVHPLVVDYLKVAPLFAIVIVSFIGHSLVKLLNLCKYNLSRRNFVLAFLPCRYHLIVFHHVSWGILLVLSSGDCSIMWCACMYMCVHTCVCSRCLWDTAWALEML